MAKKPATKKVTKIERKIPIPVEKTEQTTNKILEKNERSRNIVDEIATRIDGQIIALNDVVSPYWKDDMYSGITLNAFAEPKKQTSFVFDYSKFKEEGKSVIVIIKSLTSDQPSLKIIDKDGENISKQFIPDYPEIKRKSYYSNDFRSKFAEMRGEDTALRILSMEDLQDLEEKISQINNLSLINQMLDIETEARNKWKKARPRIITSLKYRSEELFKLQQRNRDKDPISKVVEDF